MAFELRELAMFIFTASWRLQDSGARGCKGATLIVPLLRLYWF